MKKLLLLFSLALFSLVGMGQAVINLDKTYIDSTWVSVDLDTLFFSGDSTYLTGDGDTIQFVVDSDTVALMKHTSTDPQLIVDPNIHSTATRPGLAFGDGNTGFYESEDNVLMGALEGVASLRFTSTYMDFYSSTNLRLANETPSSINPVFLPAGVDPNTGIGSAGADSLSLIAGAVEGIRIAEGGGKTKVTVYDTLNINDLASDNLVVLSTGSTGNVDTTETVDISTITIDELAVDYLDITDDIDIGDTLEFDNGAQIHNEAADTLFLVETVVKVEGNLVTTGSYNYAADAQSDDDYEVDIPGITALVEGMMVTFKANTTNTDGATLEITSVGDVDAILKMNDQVLATGDIEAGQIVVVVWDGSNWQMISHLAQ